MITIGPFRITDVEPMQALFAKHEVPAEAYADEDLKDQLIAEFHTKATGAPLHGPILDLRYIFFEIDPAHFERVEAELEKLGITRPSDGSYELAED